MIQSTIAMRIDAAVEGSAPVKWSTPGRSSGICWTWSLACQLT